MDIPILQSITDTFDADGIARASTGPTVFGTKWEVTRLVTSTTSVADTTLKVYLNSETPSALVDSTYLANNDVSETNSIMLATLDKLVFVWEGGTPGAVATGIVTGMQKGR